jgi:hypothetical protein
MSLEEYFIEGKSHNSYKIWTEIMKHHGGLGAMMQAKIGKHLHPYEIQSYMYQSLQDAINEWDSSKGKASTIWMKVTKREVQRDVRSNTCVGGVRVPYNRKDRYTSKVFEEGDISGVYYSEEDVDAAL